MEVDEEEPAQDRFRIAEAATMWNVINHPILRVFSDLTNPGTEQALKQFLESVIRFTSSSDTLSTFIIPPFKTSYVNDAVDQKYVTFTIWLSGILFNILLMPFNNENYQRSIEIQAKMLKILYSLYLPGFQEIYNRYLEIINKSLVIANCKEQKIEANDFSVPANAIDGLNLMSYSVKLDSQSITTVFIAIMQIFQQSGVLTVHHNVLWDKVMQIFRVSKPASKLVAIEMLCNLSKSNDINENQLSDFVAVNLELVRRLNRPTVSLIRPECTSMYAEYVMETLQHSYMHCDVTHLCFSIFELTSSEMVISEKALRMIFDTLRKYFNQHPKSYEFLEEDTLIRYFDDYPKSSTILAHFVAFDLSTWSVGAPAQPSVLKKSSFWRLLIKNVLETADENFPRRFKKLLKIARLMKTWMLMKKNCYIKFFDDPKNLLDRLITILRGVLTDSDTVQTIFMCFVDMLSLNEFQRADLQDIILLSCPGTTETSILDNRYSNLSKIGKSLDNLTKIECLKGICEFGGGKKRIRYLSSCISNAPVDFGVTAILNSIFLLQDPEISFTDINTHVLKPALIAQKSQFYEALAKVIRDYICILSGHARIQKHHWNSLKWYIHCKICDDRDYSRNFQLQMLPEENETLIRPYLALLTQKNLSIRKIMVENLTKISNHMKIFNTNELAANWLPLLSDPSLEIRTKLANSIERLVRNRIKLFEDLQEVKIKSEDQWPVDLEKFIDMIVNQVAISLEEALEKQGDCQHITVLKTVREYARVLIHYSMEKVCTVFIMSIMHSLSTPRAIAWATAAYNEIASDLDLTPKNFYLRYKRGLMKVIMEIACDNYREKSDNLMTSLHRVALCIGYGRSRELLRKNCNFAVSYLVPWAIEEEQLQNLFSDMAYLLGLEEKDMFIENFQHICVHVMINETFPVAIKCLKFVSKVAKSPLNELMGASFREIFRDLLLHFHTKMERVIHCLEIISGFDSDTQETQKFDSQHEIANYLKPSLHAVLVNYDSYLCSTLSDDYTRQCALASLSSLIQFMGANHLSPLKYKILATLRTSLSITRPGFQELACDAWNSFIRHLSIDDLGPLLPTICVSLSSLLELYPEKTNSMLKYLLIDQNTLDYTCELFFIEDLKVCPEILHAVTSNIIRSMPKEFEKNLQLWQKRILHETDEVRLKALIYLKKFLAKHRSELNNMILNDSNQVHPDIVQLLDALLINIQHSDDEIKVKSGECFGELGAIEPSLLPRRIISRKNNQFIGEIANSSDFAKTILMELVRAFQIQNTTQDVHCFSMAIQEILKTYEISPSGSRSRLWHSLPPTTQQIILPFLESHYKVITASEVITYPIYGTDAGSTFDKWIFNWACCMITSIKNANLSHLLNACRPALKRDIRTTIFCIPHLVTCTVIEGSDENRNGLIQEIMTVINIDNKKPNNELIERRPIWDELRPTKPSEVRAFDEERRIRCSQVIFSSLDHLRHWLEEKRLNKNDQYAEVERFMSRLDCLMLAEGCYQSREYHRALMYLEHHMATNKKALDDPREGGLLAKIYTMLNDPDGISGILVLQSQSPTIKQLMLAHELNNELQDAATCYERLAQSEDHTKYIQGMIQCYIGLEHPFTAMKFTQGILNSKPELAPRLVEHDAFWRLAHFANLDENTSIKDTFTENLVQGILPDLQTVKKHLVSQLGAASRQEYVYQQNYSHVMKLHIINEFEKTMELILKDPKNLPTMLKEWEQRFELVRGSRGVEFVLKMRRAALDLIINVVRKKTPENIEPSIATIRTEIGKIWLKSAKMARKAGLYQQCYMYILSANDQCPPQELHIEQAQLYWLRGNQEQAFVTLKRAFAIECMEPNRDESTLQSPNKKKKNFAKAKLLFAKYNEETVNVGSDTTIRYYKDAVDALKTWEKSHLTSAQYYESLFDRLSEADQDGATGMVYQLRLVTAYGKSLLYGSKYVHQSMPRMLTIWMNFALRVHMNRRHNPVQQDHTAKMSKVLETYANRLPKFAWLTAFSQLVSRIGHPSKDVQRVINIILINLIKVYPQHCLWMMASVINSSYKVRQKRCQEILNHRDLRTGDFDKLLRDFNDLWAKLIELSNRTIPSGKDITVSALSPQLPRLLKQPNFSRIIVPNSTFCQLHLPHSKASRVAVEQHKPYTLDYDTIAGISEKVMVLHSLQRPRRICLLGSNGKKYLFMCKPKDDLRRDFRLMEMNSIVNKYLQKDPESRQRRLYIRTYSVVPLNEECGLIEWLSNLTSFRQATSDIYDEKGLGISAKAVQAMFPANPEKLEIQRDVFLKRLLPRHPPVLGYWFRLNFPDPYSWYEARNAYIRTTAVMSMVGYILGLGDRHGENILLDSECGDSVHVDFNCLFNRGETFTVPERVPFRLTQNMVDAMGPLGIEGSFRRSCQITLRILRQEASPLISVLTPFVYDPLVVWSKDPVTDDNVEKTNENAVKRIKDIELRLKGVIKTQDKGKNEATVAVSLSVEGQTNHLILEAINVDNLCRMYAGWAAYV